MEGRKTLLQTKPFRFRLTSPNRLTTEHPGETQVIKILFPLRCRSCIPIARSTT